MIDPADRKLDECEVNIINDLGDQTLGDLLCDNLVSGGWMTKKYAMENEIQTEFGFYYSACGTPWKAINYVDDKTGVKKNLEGAEKLCCQWKNDKYMFKRCNGTAFKPSSSCS